MSATAYPQGFTFPPSSKPVSVTFASALSFVPHLPTATTDRSDAAYTIPAGGPGGLGDLPSDVSVRYWDERAMLRCQWASGWQEGDKRELDAAAQFRSTAKKSSKGTGLHATPTVSKEAADPAAESKGMLRRLEKDAMMPIAIKLGGGGSKAVRADKAAASAFGARAEDSDDEGGEGAKPSLPIKGRSEPVPPPPSLACSRAALISPPDSSSQQASSTRFHRWRRRARWRRASTSGTRPKRSLPTSRIMPARQARVAAASSRRQPTRCSRITTSRGLFQPYFTFSPVVDRDRAAAVRRC